MLPVWSLGWTKWHHSWTNSGSWFPAWLAQRCNTILTLAAQVTTEDRPHERSNRVRPTDPGAAAFLWAKHFMSHGNPQPRDGDLHLALAPALEASWVLAMAQAARDNPITG